MNAHPKALVVLSGGQDSTTCLLMANRAYAEVHAITFNYGQRHARELQAARDVAFLLGVQTHEVCDIGPILKGKSPLTDPNQALEQYEDFDSMDAVIGNRVELTFVPMRNALFLTLAANRAECLGAQAIYTGVCQQDNANYPDCRERFIDSQAETINEALGRTAAGMRRIDMETPLMHLQKAEAIHLVHSQYHALALFAFTHTAYDGQYPPLGRDHATVLRERGFLEAGIPDPLIVRAWMEGHYPHLPKAANYTSDDWAPHSHNFSRLCDQITACKARLHKRDLGAAAAASTSLETGDPA